MEFNLSIAFSDEDLKTFYATGTNVILAKPSAGGQTPNVAWLAFKPLSNNNLSWKEEYGIYASTQSPVSGGTLTQMSSVKVPAADGKLYTLGADAVFSGPAGSGTPDSFSILNEYMEKPYITVGLYQGANVDGKDVLKNAISAAGVIPKSTALITPYTTVYIWLASQTVGNSVVTQITSPMTELDFGGSVSSLSITYNASTGKFISAGSKKEFKMLDAAL